VAFTPYGMPSTDLTLTDAQLLIDGRPVPGRDDLEDVRQLAEFMRATGEVEPPPPMGCDLRRRIGAGPPVSAGPPWRRRGGR
jgi:hypothetical protein